MLLSLPLGLRLVVPAPYQIPFRRRWCSDPGLPPSPPRSQPQSRVSWASLAPTITPSTAHAVRGTFLDTLRAGQYTSFLKLSGIGHCATRIRWLHTGAIARAYVQ